MMQKLNRKKADTMIYQFSDFQIDTSKFLLTSNNQKVEIEPQVFDLLVFLIENNERLVTREEIFENLWHGKEVLDATLSNHIKIARSLLNDDGQTQLVIKTIRGRGYQFVTPIQIITNTASLKEREAGNPINLLSKTQKIVITSGAILLTLIVINFTLFSPTFDHVNIKPNTEIKIDSKSIAVLPFENRSELKSDLFFTDGIHDDLLTRLSKIIQLKTISRTSVMAYRNTKKNIKLIAKELGVNTILEGGVQRAGNEIRINVQLINAETDEHIWAESYTRELNAKNVFAIQTEISKAVAAQLELALVPKRENVPTQNLKALEAYFLAQFSSELDDNINYEASIKHLETAIELDDRFSEAYIELANLYLDQTYRVGLNIKGQINKSRPLLDKAIEINPNSSRAYRVYAKLNMHDQDFDNALKNYEKAVETNPNDADAQTSFGWNEFRNGRVESAIKHLRIAKALNPTDDKLTSSFSRLLIRAGHFAEAKKYLNDILKRKQNYADAYRHLSDIQLYSDHQVAESMQTLHRAITIDPKYIPSLKNMAARYVHLGLNERAIEWYQLVLDNSPNAINVAQAKMLIHFLNNDYDKTYDVLLQMSKKEPGYLYHFINNSIKADRFDEAIKEFIIIDPKLFNDMPEVNERNFPRAYWVAKWFIKSGKQEQAKWLLNKCLAIALKETSGQINGKQNNWLTKIYLALGDQVSALESFDKLVSAGFFNVGFDDSDYYSELLDLPEYQRLLKIVDEKIKAEISKISDLEANGELNLPNITN